MPPDATIADPRIYIGANDPTLTALSQTEGIVFYFGDQHAFVMTVEELTAFSGELHLWGFSNSPSLDVSKMIDLTYNTNIPTISTVTIFSQHPSTGNLTFVVINGTEVHLGGNVEPSSASGIRSEVYFFDMPASYGVKVAATAQVSSAAIAAETVVLTAGTATYRAGRIYEAEVVGLMSGSAAGASGEFRLRKGNTTAGLILSATGGIDCAVVGRNYNGYGKTYFQVIGTDVTTQMCYTLQGTGGNVTHFASATSPRYIVIRDVTDAGVSIIAPQLS